MSNLWRQAAGAAWALLALEEVATHVSGATPFVRFGKGPDGGVALLAGAGVEVRANGLPVLGGLRILEHRDELLIDGQRYYFSAQSTPVVMPFRLEEGARRPTCPVCRGQ